MEGLVKRKHYRNFDNFYGEIEMAGGFLRTVAPAGNPTQDQVFKATKRAGLPVHFEASSYLLDPVASLVAEVAYTTSEKQKEKIVRERLSELKPYIFIVGK